MQTVCNKVACINERGNITVAVVVVLLFSSVLSRPLLACKVTHVDMHVGSTASIACDYDLTTAYVGNPFYTCVEWTAGLPDDHPFEYFYEEDIGEEEWESITEVDEIPKIYRHAHITHVSWWESGQHTLRIKIRRKDVGDSWHPSNPCTVYIGKVTGVTGPNAACTSEWVEFTVTTDPAGYYDGVVWKVDGVQMQVGFETFWCIWFTTGTKTVTACLGDSCASKEIEIITGLTVLPKEAYVGLGDSKIFEAWVCDEGGSAVKKTSAQGVEWSATRGGFTGDTYTPSSVSPSKGADSVTAEYDEDEDSAVVTNFECDVTSADITVDNITVELKPAELSGTFKLELVTPDTDVIIENETRNSGTHSESFDIPNLEYVEEHENIKATWTIQGSSSIDGYPYHIRVLGPYNHTCYNTPDESGCTGALQWFSYVIANPENPCGPAPPCNWINAQGKSGWLDAIFDPEAGTGSGKGVSGYIYSREWTCSGSDYPRKLRRTGCACAQCGGCVSVGDVAIVSGHTYLACSNQVFVYRDETHKGTHTVRDKGSFPQTQLDHYHGISDCGDCPTDYYGDAPVMTIQFIE